MDHDVHIDAATIDKGSHPVVLVHPYDSLEQGAFSNTFINLGLVLNVVVKIGLVGSALVLWVLGVLELATTFLVVVLVLSLILVLLIATMPSLLLVLRLTEFALTTKSFASYISSAGTLTLVVTPICIRVLLLASLIVPELVASLLLCSEVKLFLLPSLLFVIALLGIVLLVVVGLLSLSIIFIVSVLIILTDFIFVLVLGEGILLPTIVRVLLGITPFSLSILWVV